MFESIFKFLSEQTNSGFWQYEFLGNTIKGFLIALIVFFVSLIIFKIFQSIVLYKLKKIAEKTKTDIDDTFVKIINTLRPPFYSFLSFYLALNFLAIKNIAEKIINIILVAWVIYLAITAIKILIDYVIKRSMKKYQEDDHAKSAMRLLGNISKAVLWCIGVLLFLSNLGVNITSLVAGLGIGGIAIALALQNILGDLFSSFAIYFDRPFTVGDFIIVGEQSGIVEKVGIKTTRIRALRGEEIVISNKELTSARIQNFKKMKERRITFSFGVVYNTLSEKMKKIPSIIKEIVESEKLARFDRAHFHEFGDSALLFEVVYYIQTGEYNDYMDANQGMMLKIKTAFEKENIVMAYPTQTVYLEK
ncbi:MAG: mechanosensitive ion channel family protein [Patescibacteria group bacterium]|nr:mechanosensitive ion channel family protein [Patescibacteria group bacterium]